MAYRFRLDEDLESGLRRIVCEQIDKAAKELSRDDAWALAIHESRKCLKRIRALLRLVRQGLQEVTFQRENARFRDVAAALGGTRDHDILDETVLKLEGRCATTTRSSLATIRKYIHLSRHSSAEGFAGKRKAALRHLEDASDVFRRMHLEDASPSVLQMGLEASYRRARRAMKAAYQASNDEAFHEWRKPVQLHWRHMALFARAWPELFEARVQMARSLSQLLGDDHDLSILIAFVHDAMDNGTISETTAHKLEKVARERQMELRASAEPFGAMLLSESARPHARRVLKIWAAAQRLKDGSQPQLTQETAEATAAAGE